MPINFFCGDEFPEHEYDQFKRIKNILIDVFKKSKENIYVFYNFKIATNKGWQNQIDVMLLLSNKIIDLEMKDCEGKINGDVDENNNWTMINEDGNVVDCKRNFFIQCGEHRKTIINKIVELKETNKLNLDELDMKFMTDRGKLARMISSWVCLKGNGQFIGNIDINKNPWFFVTNEYELRNSIKRAGGNYSISDKFKESLKDALGLKESIYKNDSYYFMDSRLDELLKIDESENLSLENFRKEIENQNLNYDRIEEIIFRAAIGGLYTRNEILKESRREERYLEGFGFIKSIRKYDRYPIYYYLITEKSKVIAEAIIKKRILKSRKEIIELISIFGINVFMISLLGGEGSLNGDPFDWKRINEYVLNQAIEGEIINQIPNNLMWHIRQIFESNPFQIQREKIFDNLYKMGLCNKEGNYNSNNHYSYEFYRVPINYLLKTIDIESWINSIDENKILEFVKWKLILDENGEINRNKELFEEHGIVIDKSLYDEFMNMFYQGITSKPIDEKDLRIIIYDEEKFRSYCEDKMQNILNQLATKH